MPHKPTCNCPECFRKLAQNADSRITSEETEEYAIPDRLKDNVVFQKLMEQDKLDSTGPEQDPSVRAKEIAIGEAMRLLVDCGYKVTL